MAQTTTKPRMLYLALLLAAAVGIAFRLWLMAVGRINSDDAIVGLMGMEILKGHHFGFYWGQAYMGSLEAYGAALVFALRGVSTFALKIVPFTFFLLAVLFHGLFARRIAGRDAGLMTAILLFISPSVFTLWSTAPRGGYMEALAFGGAILLLAAQMAERRDAGAGRWMLLGLIAGLGFWTHFFFVYYLLPVGLVVVLPGLFRPGRLRRLVALTAGFVIGFAPAIIWNLRHSFASFGMTRMAGAVNLHANLKNLLGRQLPLLLAGGSLTSPVDNLAAHTILWSVLALHAVAAIVYVASLSRSGGAPRSARLLPVLVSLTIGALFVLTGFGRFNTPRYLLPIYPMAAIFTGVFLARLLSSWRRVATVLVALLVLWTGWANWSYCAGPFLAQSRAFNRRMGEVIAYCRANRIKTAWAGHWVAYALTFLSKEEVIVGDADRNRYPRFQEAAAETPHPAVIVEGGRRRTEETLQALGYRFKARTIGPYTVFGPLTIAPEIGPAAPDLIPTVRVAPTPAATGKEPASAVFSLAAEGPVNGVLLTIPPGRTAPRGLAVDLSTIGFPWAEAAVARDYQRGIYRLGNRLVFGRGGRLALKAQPAGDGDFLSLAFPARSARFIRLRPLGAGDFAGVTLQVTRPSTAPSGTGATRP